MDLLFRLRSGWTALKFLRVGLGGLILYSSIQERQVPGILLGALFLLLGLFTEGVCCAGSCSAPVSKSDKKTMEETKYEEVGTGK